MLKEQKGITLVALVITVIVLLILAGVAMSLITGEEGLFSRTNHAATVYSENTQKEGNEWNSVTNAFNTYYDQYVQE